ncbi:MAG: hypothetical protein ACOY3Z_08180 [Thermodesulfobacteriota bacterium]
MFLDPWAIALTLCGFLALALLARACRAAVRVLRFWNPASDDTLQIRLESEIWLSSTLVAYGLGFQMIGLILLVLAADHFASAIVGAMCATGSLLANPYGVPALVVKLAGVFLYGFWILLHQLDIRSEHYPLVRFKYAYLLLLLPLFLADLALQSLYVAGLKPEIITSCCAVVFGGSSGGGTNLLASSSPQGLLALFAASILLLAGVATGLWRNWRPWLGWLHAAGWAWFLPLALVVVTTVVSSYVYAMPYHKCPFCLLKPEYHYFGFPLYGTLLAGSFLGITAGVAGAFSGRPGLAGVVAGYQRMAVRLSLVLLGIFASLSFYHFGKYLLMGGEG